MEYKKRIIQVIDRFYVDCVEEFKEAELKIARDSKFRRIFRKKDYGSNIQILRDCRKRTGSLRFPMGDIPKEDQQTRDLIRQAEGAIRQFSRLCDAYVQMQISLQKKSEGEDVSYKDYREVYNRSQEERIAMNEQLAELDLLYTDYIEDEDYDVYEYLDLAGVLASDETDKEL